MFLTLGDCWCGCPTNLMMIDTGWRRACSITAILVRSLGAIAASERDNAATDRISRRCSRNAGPNFRFSERGRSLRYGRLCCRGVLNLAISKSCWSKTSRWLRDGRRRSVERRRRYHRGALRDSRQAIEFLHANDVDVAVIDFVLADENSEGLQAAVDTKGIHASR